MKLPPELHYEIWEVLAPHAFCDRDATDWTDEIWNLLKEHLEDEEYPQYDHACFYGCTHPDHGGPEYS